MRYGFFPGCSLGATARAYGMSFERIARVLDLDMPELEDWNCCGSTVFQSLGEASSLSLSARNLALAEKSGSKELVTPCAACFAVLRKATEYLAHKPELKGQVDAALRETGLRYGGGVGVRHLLDVLVNDIGLDAVRAKVTHPLAGLKVACYYGCLLTRPPAITGAPHHEYPVTMDRLVTALGAVALDWSYKTECCGAAFAVSRPELVTRLVERIIDDARGVGAEMVVAACPHCQGNLDMYQRDSAEGPLPIVYFTQLMGLAFGASPRDLGLAKHFRDPAPTLRRHSLVV